METTQPTALNAEPLLDELDEAIIGVLTTDGRTPFSEIAKSLGVSANTVRNRLKALLDNDVIEISAYPNPNRGSARLRVQLVFRVDANSYVEVSKRLSECPPIHYLALTSGQYDMIALASFGDRKDLLDFITNVLSRTPGIVSMASSIVLEVAKSRGRVLRPFAGRLEADAETRP